MEKEFNDVLQFFKENQEGFTVYVGEIIGILGKNEFTFITANYLLNLLTIVLRQIPNSYESIINDSSSFMNEFS